MRYSVSHLDSGDTYDENLAAEAFSTYMTSQETRILKTVVPRLFGGRVSRYLDFACGTGRITQVVAPLAEESYGVDVSESMLRVAREKSPDTHFLCADITRDRCEREPFDLITAFRFFGNAEDALRRDALSTIPGLTATGGYLILNDHRNPLAVRALLHRATGGSTDFDLTWFKLKKMLSENSFRTVAVYGIGGWLLRHGMNRHLENLRPWMRILEAVSRSRLVAPFCPDMVVVARKEA